MRDIDEYSILPNSIIELEKVLRKHLFSMGPMELASFFIKYEVYYGESAAKYAKATLRKWKSGQVCTSDKTDQRLLSLVPLYMSPDFRVKYVSCLARENPIIYMEPSLKTFDYYPYSSCIKRCRYNNAQLHVNLYRRKGLYPQPYGKAFHAVHNFLLKLSRARIETYLGINDNRIPWLHEGVGLAAKEAVLKIQESEARQQLNNIYKSYQNFLKRLDNTQLEDKFEAYFPDGSILCISVKNMGFTEAIFNRIVNFF